MITPRESSGTHPYFVAAYDFTHSRPLKRSLIALSSPLSAPPPPPSPSPHPSAPSLKDIVSDLRALSSHTAEKQKLAESKLIVDIGCWIQCVEIQGNGKLIEHRVVNNGLASRGSSTPGTSNESTTDVSDDQGASETGLLSSSHRNDIPSDDKPDVELLPALISSPLSFKERLGQSRFLVPLHFLSSDLIRPKQYNENSLLSISLIHFASIANRPQLVKFLITECNCSKDSFVTVVDVSQTVVSPKHDRLGPLTPLMLACQKDHIAVVSVLLSHTADTQLRDASGEVMI